MSKSNTVLPCLLLAFLLFSQTQAKILNPITPHEMQTILHTIDSFFFAQHPKYNVEIAKLLRSAFHDCMGGCDGSLNLTNGANRGLEGLAQELSKAYSFSINSQSNPSSYKLFNKLSRADFWVLTEERALAWGIKRSGVTPNVNFHSGHYSYGRVSTEPFDLDNYQGTLPGGGNAWQTMLNDVATGLPAINETDVVALLGLHGTGGAKLNNSGFSGKWGPATDQNIVNNHYYINLLSYKYPNNQFTQVAASSVITAPPKNPLYRSEAPPTDNIEWLHTKGNSPAQMMLPIDMQIYLKFTPNATGGETEGSYCGVGKNGTLFNCPRLNSGSHKYLPLAKNAGLALKYAQNNTFYITSVVTAFLKMVSYTNPHTLLTPFKAENVCVNGVVTCLGDVLFAGCTNVIHC